MQQIKLPGWLRRNWGKLILMPVVAFVLASIWKIDDDRAQRDRVTVAALQIAPIRDAVNEQFKKSGRFPTDLRPFVKQSHYSIDHSRLGRIGFSVAAEGKRLRVLFDSDQGPFAEKLLIVEGNENNGSTNWRCSMPGVPGHYLPANCR